MQNSQPAASPSLSYSGGLSVEQVRDRVTVDKIYKLSSNENPLGPSPQVLTAVQKAAANLHIYPPRKDGRFCRVLADFHERGLTADHFLTAVSGVETIELIARTLISPGDEAIVCPPTFGWYVRAVEKQGGSITAVALLPDSFAHDIDGILAAITPRTKLLFICNPNNPTGAMMTASELAQLMDGLPPHVTLVADDVYHHFVTRDDYADSLGYVLDGRKVIVVHSFSKAYGLAGLRLGYAIAPPELAAKVRGMKRPFHLSSLAEAAGIAALHDAAHLQNVLNVVQAGKAYFYEQLTELGVPFWHSETNFVLIRPFSNADTVYDQLLERGIMVRPTKSNGLPGYLRVTVSLPEANAAFIAALREIVKKSAEC